jgi:hypothetical protein
MADAFRAGLFVQFRAEPRAVAKDGTVRVVAVLHLPARSRATLLPTIKCEEVPNFHMSLVEERTGIERERAFAANLKVQRLGIMSGSVTLTLEPRSGDPAIASTTLHIFKPEEIAEANRELSED